MINRQYPIHYVTYVKNKKNKKLPEEVPVSVYDTEKQGFHVLPILADDYAVPDEVKAYHAGFKHMRDIAMPRIVYLKNKNPNLQGAFIVEGDLCLDADFTFKKFLSMKLNKPTWLGYKKILYNKGEIDYVVGNFMIYIPRDYIDKMAEWFNEQKQLVYSDRFFTKLVTSGKLQIYTDKSYASEIEHDSNVKGGIRVSNCRIKLTKNSKKKKLTVRVASRKNSNLQN